MEQITKKCKKCGEEKELSKFYKDKQRKDGFRSNCKKCINERIKELYDDNPEKARERTKRWYKNNLEKAREGWRKYQRDNPEKIKETQKKYYQNNIEKFKEKNRKWRENNIEKRREYYGEYNKKYYKKNSEKIKESVKKYRQNNSEKINKYIQNKIKTNIHFKIKCNISRAIGTKLKYRLSSKNRKSTFSFLPYTIDDLIKHLESLFQPWMNWQNYGKKVGCWVIDHKKPDSLFNYKSVEDEEFQRCWALENLQPMEFIENSKKGDKYLLEKQDLCYNVVNLEISREKVGLMV